jgi:hypothetical protein
VLLSRWCFHQIGGAVGEHLLGEAGSDAEGVAWGT